MAAFVRVSGLPNRNFLVGYTGISATVPRIQGTVEVRPSVGYSAPVSVSLVRICLQRRESIHPAAENMARRHLSAPRRENVDVIGKEYILYTCTAGRESDSVVVMDLPFMIFIPYGRGGNEVSRLIPPATLQLPSRTAETFYELVVTVQQGPSIQNKYSFPIPLLRYDTLSTFGMYNTPKPNRASTDSIAFLEISLPKRSYGPLDPINVYIRITPNKDWMRKARKVTIEKITLQVEEEITYNPEGDEATKKVNKLVKKTEAIREKLPEAGYMTSLGLIFPARELRDSDGVIKPPKPGFPQYEVTSFTTSSYLYRIEFFLTIKATLSSARDIIIREPIIVCPFDSESCKQEMEAIEQAARDASHIDKHNPRLPSPHVIYANQPNSLSALGLCLVGDQKKPLID
ncbi:hypothetical protein BROUX41_000515 [Berkeleyomyces rouxiae]|uniref:uncharacterized protein n=1 Tax=Berkeleyomyces rouxiae TaxID=2035830 RepID=UPI003B7953D4